MPHTPSITAVVHDDFKNPPSGRPAKLMAENLGRNYNTLMQELERRPLHKFALDELIPTMRQTGSVRPLEAIAEEVNGVFVPLPKVSGGLKAAERQCIHTIKEFADLAQATGAALADGDVSQTEYAHIKKEAWESIQAHLMLLKALELECGEGA